MDILDLPEIIMFQILAFLDVESILTTISSVCTDWKEKITGEAFWKSLRSISLAQSMKQNFFIEDVIEKCPNLRYLKIRIHKCASKRNGDSNRPHLPFLRTLKVHSWEPEYQEYIADIIESAPHIEVLRVHVFCKITKALVESISLLKELVNLDISQYATLAELTLNKYKNKYDLPFPELFQKCSKLEHVKFGLVDCDPELVFHDLIRYRFNTLRSINWGFMVTEQTFQIITRCNLLTTLNINYFDNIDISSNINYKTFEILTDLNKLQTLYICFRDTMSTVSDYSLKNFFDRNPFPHLKNLAIIEADSLDDSALESIASNCGNLETLYFDCCPYITDEGMNHIINRCRRLRVIRTEKIMMPFQFVSDIFNKLPSLKLFSLPSHQLSELTLGNMPDIKVIKDVQLRPVFANVDPSCSCEFKLSFTWRSAVLLRNNVTIFDMLGYKVSHNG